MLPEGIELLDIETFQNKHENFKQKLVKGASFHLFNPKSNGVGKNRYRATTKNLQWLIQHGIDNQLRLRALGSGWSFSKVAATNGGLIDTKELRLSFKLNDDFLTPEYLGTGKNADDLFFVQCGMSILHLNKKLEKEQNRSLKASGASNGQTVVGATATGTHGSAFKVGAVHDSVVGMHIVVGPNRHVWVERASNPVASDKFVDWLDAERISDDAIFNAAIVSFGSFGIVHGLMFETEPIFLLEERRRKVPYNDDLRQLINHLDFENFNGDFPTTTSPGADLYHFEMMVNPHHLEPDNLDKGVFIKALYKLPYRSDYTPIAINSNGFTYGDDVLGVIQKVIDSIGTGIVPLLVNQLFPLAYSGEDGATGTVGETFSNTNLRGQTASAAMGINNKDASTVLEEILALNEETPLAGAISLRFVKGTKATLGFTHFAHTCILELDGVDSDKTRKFYQAVWDRLELLGIPYTLHWGKINFNLDAPRVRQMYSDEAVDAWIASRNKLLDKDTQAVFTNDFIHQCGLDTFIPLPVPPPIV